VTNLSALFPVPTRDDFYKPAMMQYDGNSAFYESPSVSWSGNKVTALLRIKRTSFSGGSMEHVMRSSDATGQQRLQITVHPNDDADTGRRDRVRLFVKNSTGTGICTIVSETSVMDGNAHMLLIAFDGDGGTASMIVDGVTEDDTGYASRVAPTTGTLGTSSGFMLVGSSSDTGADYFGGQLGSVGFHEAYLTNWREFMDHRGYPKELDESGWTEWGTQPLYWNENGEMSNNLGSKVDMAINATLNIGKGGN